MLFRSLSASQNLADGVASGEAQAKRYGGVIHGQTQRLSSMVEQVLRFAGLSSEHGIQHAPVPVEPLIEEALLDCRAELDAVGAEVDVDVEVGLRDIDGDRAALLHCLRNLLSNAAKHGDGKPVRVVARADGEMVEIQIGRAHV